MMMVNGFCFILYQVKVKMLVGISISRLILSEEISDGSEAVVHDCSPTVVGMIYPIYGTCQ
jgi:hypothetical protein